jgi:hypothetical protein
LYTNNINRLVNTISRFSSAVKTHEPLSVTPPPEVGSNRTFGFVFAAAFTVIFLAPLLQGTPVRWWAGGIALAFVVLSTLAPHLLAPLNRAWHRLGLILGKVVSPLIIGALFLSTVTPIGLLMRLFGKDPLLCRFDRKATSYWTLRANQPSWAESLKNQF